MTLFVDASALVAVIKNEPERDAMATRLTLEPSLLWSAMTCWETVLALCRSCDRQVADAHAEVQTIAAYFGFSLVPIADEELHLALDAFERYGKGRHPARLNMGDCFAYACAKTNNARLLYKGDDFSKTDLA